ncbi:MAG: substrate-binding domain-containing protein [Lachnospiraceae bacterium]|nr:substrate-binding domain-containing protein [Lachnospiraceae bacterium]
MYKDRKVIGICTAELDQKYHVKILERVVRELINLGYYVMLFSSDSDLYYWTKSDEADASVYDLMNTDRLDAVLIFSETIRNQGTLERMVKRLHENHVPVLTYGTDLDGCYSVIYDTDAEFEKLVRHVVEYHGMREVNFISGIQGNDIAERRLEIYREVLEDNNILYEEERVGYGDFWFGPTREVMERFMDPGKVPPEAIICANDSMAITVCDYLREHQVKVPEDIIVTGIDGIDDGIWHLPGITTCVRDEFHDAKIIAALLSDLCAGRQISGTTVLTYHIQLSQSCGCQEKHIFDANGVIRDQRSELESYRTDVHKFSEMSDEFLQAQTDQEFWDVAGKYLPDNSFLCINSGLSIEGASVQEEALCGFTPKLNAMVHLEGEILKSDCYLEYVVPEAGKNMMHDRPILLLPVHFCEHIVGYFGIWLESGRQKQFGQLIHFLLSLDHSAAKRLVEEIRH